MACVLEPHQTENLHEPHDIGLPDGVSSLPSSEFTSMHRWTGSEDVYPPDGMMSDLLSGPDLDTTVPCAMIHAQEPSQSIDIFDLFNCADLRTAIVPNNPLRLTESTPLYTGFNTGRRIFGPLPDDGIEYSTSNVDLSGAVRFDGDDISACSYLIPSTPSNLATPHRNSCMNDEEDDYLGLDADEETRCLQYGLRTGVRARHYGQQVVTYDQDETGDYNTDEERERNRLDRKRKMRPAQDYRSIGYGDTEEEIGRTKRVRRGEHDIVRLLGVVRFTSQEFKARYADLVRQREFQQLQQLSENDAQTYNLRQRHPNPTASDESCVIQTNGNHAPDSFVGHPVGRGCYECLSVGARCSMLDNEFEWPCQSCQGEDHECIPILPPTKKTACSHCVALGKRQKWLICSYLYEDQHDKPCRYCAATNGGQSCFAGPDLSEVRHRIYIGDDHQPFVNERPTINAPKVRRSCLACQAAFRNCSLSVDRKFTDSICIACDMKGEICVPVSTNERLCLSAITAQSNREVQQEEVGQVDKDLTSLQLAGDLQDLSTGSNNNRHDHGCQQPQTSSMPEVIELSDDSDDSDEEQKAAGMDQPIRQAERRVVPWTANSHSRSHGNLLPDNITTACRQPTATANKDKLIKRPPSKRPLNSVISKVFLTKLCHPITFNHDDFMDENKPCHFCCEPAYSIFGLPRSKVLALKLPGGKGWKELRCAPPRALTPTTKVCLTCTADRFCIMQCSGHLLRSLGRRYQADSLREARARLIDDGVRTEAWCSVCCNLASYTCCARLPKDLGTISLRGGTGCGLHLCEHCAVDLSSLEGDLQTMLFELKDIVSNKRPYGLRADWDLLKKGGLLEQFIRGS